MPTLHIRNVPSELYEALRERAKTNGRSINAEVIDLLGRGVARRRRNGRWWTEFERVRSEWRLPPDAPRPEDLIREDRDFGH